jgi:integrase
MSDNLYQRGGVWYARVQVRGREIRRSLRTVSKPEAKRRLAKVLEQAEHFQFYGENRHTWKEATVEWGKHAAEHIKLSTLNRYRVSLGQLRGILDELYVDEITRKTISQIARRPGVTNATRRRDITAVSAVLGWCVGHGWREDNPAREWDRSIIRERRDPITLPSESDIAAVVTEAPGNFAKLIRWAQYTGMREEECGSLERPQVNERRKAADLTKTKTNRPRSVPLDDRAVGTYVGTPPRLGCPWVFWHEPGERYLNIASRFVEIVKRAIRKAEAAKRQPPKRFRFHDLRHWFAVDYLRRGGSVYDLQKILGHASIKTTEIYLDYLTPDEQDASKRAAHGSAHV